MILSRMRREWASWTLLWWAPIGLIMGVWIFGMCRYTGKEIGPVPFDDMTSGAFSALLISWMLLSIALLAAGSNQRSSGRLDLALPLEPRRLWTGHMMAVLLPVAALLAVAAGTVAALNAAIGIRPLLQPGLISFCLGLAAGFLLALAVLQSPRPELHRIPFTRGYALVTIATLGGVLGLVLLLSTLPLIWVLVPFGAALVLLVRIYCLLPAAFAIVSRDPLRGDAPETILRRVDAVGEAPVGRARSFWLLHSTIWRSAIGNWSWLFLIAFGFHGHVLSLSFTVDEGRGAAFVYLFFTWSILSCWLLISVRKLHALDALPISRGRIFAVFVLSALLFLGAGFGVGVGLGAATGDFPPEVRLDVMECCYRIEVPHEYRRIAWDGVIPPTVAPWGEKVVPAGTTLLKGGSVCSYSPFDVDAGSTAEFTAWQLSRAMKTVYGKTIAADVIRERCLAVSPDGTPTRPAGRLSLPHRFDDLDSGAGTCIIPVVFLVVILSWLIFGALAYRAQRGKPGFSLWLVGPIAGFVAVLTVGVGGLAADSMGLIDLVAFSDIFSILARELHAILPGGAYTIWAGSIALFACGYLLAQKQFALVEAQQERKASS